MKKLSLEEWRKEGTDLFGSDMRQWKFKCSKCGNIQCIEDVEMIGVEQADTKVFNECSLCGVELKNENSIHLTEIIDANDNAHPSFEFATKEDMESFEETALASLISAGKEEANTSDTLNTSSSNEIIIEDSVIKLDETGKLSNDLNNEVTDDNESKNDNPHTPTELIWDSNKTNDYVESEDNKLTGELSEKEEKETLVPEITPDEPVVEEESNTENKVKEQIEKIGELKQNLEELRESNPDINPEEKPEEE